MRRVAIPSNRVYGGGRVNLGDQEHSLPAVNPPFLSLAVLHSVDASTSPRHKHGNIQIFTQSKHKQLLMIH
ncbi:hypothetical protein Y032_0418g1117 [Ancylostoma ceylanicum]|uniref:Uncharacterized protein n=1 Tax=Ancylostoma ceylanicum TaxID=53326 RepID=A0A016X1L1_9BILA|nr:hypothetical protein Y032_0418g1117 [Ancylostoma ceylanicum]